MTSRLVVTGSHGLIGVPLASALEALGYEVYRFDLKGELPQYTVDIRNPLAVEGAIRKCTGIVHLAAVSRVIWGQQNPDWCRSTNIDGTRNVITAAVTASPRPWVLFASSREVYGEAAHLPVTEATPLHPLNVYAHSKVVGEQLIYDAQKSGLVAGIVRLSNVYGSVTDHHDRVIPAFTRAAATGSAMRLDGPSNIFDFTHVSDAVRGLVTMIDLLERERRSLLPIHLLTGRPTSLEELAATANRLGGERCAISMAASRTFDVSRFYGDPSRAKALLGWEAQVSLESGIADLIEQYKRTEATQSRRAE